jgi:hypothetical protein
LGYHMSLLRDHMTLEPSRFSSQPVVRRTRLCKEIDEAISLRLCYCQRSTAAGVRKRIAWPDCSHHISLAGSIGLGCWEGLNEEHTPVVAREGDTAPQTRHEKGHSWCLIQIKSGEQWAGEDPCLTSPRDSHRTLQICVASHGRSLRPGRRLAGFPCTQNGCQAGIPSRCTSDATLYVILTASQTVVITRERKPSSCGAMSAEEYTARSSGVFYP